VGRRGGETRARYRLVAPPYPLQILPALPQ